VSGARDTVIGVSTPNLPAPIAAAIADYPEATRDTLLELRALIHRVAARTEGVDAVEETLRWGQPAFICRSGTTVRLAEARGGSGAVGVYTSCQTPLVADFAREHGELFEYDAGRGIHIPAGERMREAEIGDFLSAALTYKLRRRSGAS